MLDDGQEFVGKDPDRWAYDHGVEPAFIQPGKPVQKAFIESFNGTMRNECLNEQWFLNLNDAREIIENWRIAYNTNRPHREITPYELAASPSLGESEMNQTNSINQPPSHKWYACSSSR